MSNISPDFIHSVGYLYEEINVQQQDFLNEDSDYYDAEGAELVEDILSYVSLSMIYEGYSANAVIGFLADSSEEDILEKYLSFDDNILSENTVDGNYIQEQLEILDYIITEGWKDKLATSVGRFFAKRAPALSKGPGMLSQKAAYRLAMKGDPTLATKARVGIERTIGPKGRKAVQAIKDFGSKAKSALTGPTAQKIGKGLGILGLGAAGGYMGAKLAGAGSGSEKITGSPKQTPSSTKDDFLKGSALAKLGGKEGRIKGGEFRTMSWSPESKKRYAAATKGAAKSTPSSATPASTSSGSSSKPSSTPAAKPKSQDVAKPGETKMQQWARLNPKLAAKVEPGQSGYEEISQTRVKPSPYEKQNQTPTQGPSGAEIDTKSVENAKKEFEDRMKKNKVTTSTSTTKESYEPYDVILEYLIGRGHVDTIEEAHYVMLEMDESAVCRIIEEYNDYVLAEEVSEWVDSLLEDGYDLSEYTWDDIVEYYVVESNR